MSGNRELVEETVEDNPGIGFNDLKRETGLSNGVLQHHLRKSDKLMKKKGAILPKGACGDCRFKQLCGQKCILNVLKDEQMKQVLKWKSEGVTQTEIADRLGIDDSTVSYHVNKLHEFKLLGEEVEEMIEAGNV